MSRREKEGDSRREKRVGWRRKAKRGGAGRRGQLREDGVGRRSEEGPASGEWRGRTEEEAGTESSKEEEVTARGADGGGATGVDRHTARTED